MNILLSDDCYIASRGDNYAEMALHGLTPRIINQSTLSSVRTGDGQVNISW